MKAKNVVNIYVFSNEVIITGMSLHISEFCKYLGNVWGSYPHANAWFLQMMGNAHSHKAVIDQKCSYCVFLMTNHNNSAFAQWGLESWKCVDAVLEGGLQHGWRLTLGTERRKDEADQERHWVPVQFVKPGSRPVTLSCVFPRVVPVQAGSGSPPPAAIQPVTELLSYWVSFLLFCFLKMCTFGHERQRSVS